MIQNNFHSLNFIICLSVVLISEQIFFKTNAIPEIQPPNYDTVFDDSFLKVVSIINNNIISLIYGKNKKYINNSLINHDDMNLLSRSCKDDYECRQKKESSLNKLKKELDLLECLHTFLCLQILDVLKKARNLNSNHIIKINYQYVTEYIIRMISFFIYGKFVVNPWQYDFAMKAIDIAKLERKKENTYEISLKFINDSSLFFTMNKFCENCKKTNEVLKLITTLIFNKFQEKNIQFSTHENFVLNIVKNLLIKTNLPCISKMYNAAHIFIHKANQKEVVVDEAYENTKKDFLQSLKLSKSDIESYERETINFFDKHLWEKDGWNRLSAAYFYRASSLKQNSSKKSILKKVLRVQPEKSENEDNIPCTVKYGRVNEPKAKELFEMITDLQIELCGVFIDENLNYLTAKPDGLIGKDGIVEIKCPLNAQNMIPKLAIKQKVIKYVHYNENEDLVIKRSSDIFYQIQGELHITKRHYCYLIIWTPKGIVYSKILRDDKFWNDKMEERLIYFYENIMLPEILNRQFFKNLNIVNT
ncbi:uncharacterized protein LOC126896999 [Daktulosphaira vitifoliae]|uniref:uncharacterized protein LOC126896999 n=1 Tax=Daktulosphaira vitifoliae TaxID=58002 RepID=UPI0021A9A94F|nr:uncharacterized protein LOC126896999 [Daktulosphaira vitifoliae]